VQALRREIHQTIEKVTDDLGRRQTFNTAVAKIMELLNSLQKAEMNDEHDIALLHEGLMAMVQLLNPITPHICEALWELLGGKGELQTSAWPLVDSSALIEDEKLIVVQVNGKVRAKMTVSADISSEQAQQEALTQENVQPFIEGKKVRKVIYIAGKLVNIVAN
jgi:leucyl-tRNA synthetase